MVTMIAFILFWLFGHSLWGLIIGVILLDLGTQGTHISNQTRIYRLNAAARSRLNTVYMVSYFIGAIPMGVLVADRRRIDIRKHGSGRTGMTNVLRTVGRRAAALVPALGELGVTGAWSGVRPTSPDSFPLIGWVPGVDGLFVAGGHGGAGVVLGGGSARLAAQLLVGETPFTDPSPFDPVRFVTGYDLSSD